MSLIILSTIGAGSLYAFQRSWQKKQQKLPAKPSDTTAERWHYTGTYNEAADISQLLGHPGFVVSEKEGTDLTGMPCRWLTLKNGAVYRTYDTQTKFPKENI